MPIGQTTTSESAEGTKVAVQTAAGTKSTITAPDGTANVQETAASEDEKKAFAKKADAWKGVDADTRDINYVATLAILFIFLIYVPWSTGRSPPSRWSSSRRTSGTRPCPCSTTSGTAGRGQGQHPAEPVIVALKGNIYAGLWYPIMEDRDISTYEH